MAVVKHDTENNGRIVMRDNIFHTLRFYRDNDMKGKGVLGVPHRIKIQDVNSCVKHGWLSERPVGVNSVYRVTEIGHKAVREKEKYLNEKLRTDPTLRKHCNFSLDDRPRTLRARL